MAGVQKPESLRSKLVGIELNRRIPTNYKHFGIDMGKPYD